MDQNPGTTDNTPTQQALPGVAPLPADDGKAKELVATQAKLAKIEAANKRREADDQAKRDAAALEDGKAKELLTAKASELAAAQARLEKLEAAEIARADKLFAGLPDASKTKLAAFRDKLDIADWSALLDAEASQAAAGGAAGVQSVAGASSTVAHNTPPPTGSAVPPGKRGGKREPSQKAIEIVERHMMLRDDSWLRKLDAIPDESGTVKFTMSVKDMMAGMTAGKPRSLDENEAFIRDSARRR